jgi:hypothetical protein
MGRRAVRRNPATADGCHDHAHADLPPGPSRRSRHLPHRRCRSRGRAVRNLGGLLLTVGGIALGMLAVLLSYALARGGNPEAVWFWRDVLGVHFP